ncbi:MAG: hypothetical protein DRP85_08765 [Candidatus Makaraimicrobium thalassicum]|nr:MAG: hypothetical protein DRP85_08765 [Candidatus Omnitrophota bacterium]
MKHNISHSFLTSMQFCERRAYVFSKYGLGYEDGGNNKAMNLGRAIHKLLENYHVVGQPIAQHNHLKTSFQSVIKDDMSNISILTDALVIVTQYERWLHRIIKEDHWYTKLIVLSQEEKVTHNRVTGVFDLRVTDGVKHYILDFKTTGGQLMLFERTIRSSEQFMLYCKLAQQIGYGSDGIIVVALKTKSVSPTTILLKNGKVSVAKNNPTSYEVFSKYLEDTQRPRYMYEEHLLWLLNEGASNKVYKHTYPQKALDIAYRKVLRRQQRIDKIDSLEDCDYNQTFTCPVKCPIYNQCTNMMYGLEPDFSHLTKRKQKVNMRFVFGDK